MARTSSGFLTEDALRSGLKDQYAKEIGPSVHTIELTWDRVEQQYTVLHTATIATGAEYTRTLLCGDSVARARAMFRREVRSLGGRA